jgi:hypothetical protein
LNIKRTGDPISLIDIIEITISQEV